MTIADGSRCPCLSGEVYGACCAPFHRGEATAPTAERLMRSRYSAFAVGAADYLLATWHPSTRPTELELDPTLRWYRLDILGRTGGGLLDATGTVTFEARFREGGSPGLLRETSNFVREDGRWSYVDGHTG